MVTAPQSVHRSWFVFFKLDGSLSKVLKRLVWVILELVSLTVRKLTNLYNCNTTHDICCSDCWDGCSSAVDTGSNRHHLRDAFPLHMTCSLDPRGRDNSDSWCRMADSYRLPHTHWNTPHNIFSYSWKRFSKSFPSEEGGGADSFCVHSFSACHHIFCFIPETELAVWRTFLDILSGTCHCPNRGQTYTICSLMTGPHHK